MSRRALLALYFAIIAAMLVSVWFACDHALTPTGLAIGIPYVGLLARVGYRARDGGPWGLQLLACNLALCALAPFAQRTHAESELGAIGDWLVSTGIFTLAGLLVFGAAIIADRDSSKARDGSLAARADRRLATMGLLLFLEYVLIGVVLLTGLPLVVRIAAALLWVGPKLAFFVGNALTIRHILATGRELEALSPTAQRPGSDVPQIDLGVGDALHVEVAPALGYRDAPVTVRAVLGSARASIALVRRQTRQYCKLWAVTWIAPLIALLVVCLLSQR